MIGELADLHRLVVAPAPPADRHRDAAGRGRLRAVRRPAPAPVLLEVDYHNEPAIALYQRLGFEQLAARENYYGPGRHALILKLYDLSTAPTGQPGHDAGAVSGPLILGIESSCDETGVGIVRGHELLANEVASSVAEHVRFGGVVPEVASRAHLEAMLPTLQRACATADIDLTELDGIAVTAGPGLMGALVVGLAAAKALAYALDKPLYAVNHLAGHVAVDLLEHGPLPRPCVGAAGLRRAHLAAAGRRRRHARSPNSAATIDDAAGEAYDKVARLLGLPYPGGPHIDRAAPTGDPAGVRFPRGLTAPQGPGAAPVRLLVLRA